MYFDHIYLPLPNFTQIHSQSRPSQYFVLFITIQLSLCCPHSLGSGTFHLSVYGQPTRGHILKESKHLLSQQLSIANNSSTRDETSCPPPFSMLEFRLLHVHSCGLPEHRLTDKSRRWAPAQ